MSLSDDCKDRQADSVDERAATGQQEAPGVSSIGVDPKVASDGYLSADRSHRTAILPNIGHFKKEDVIKHIAKSPIGLGIEAVIFFTAAACRLVFSSVEAAEGWVVRGLNIGSHHFDLNLEQDAKPPLWITMKNIPLETGHSDVRRKLVDYGKILKGPFYNNHPGTKIKNGLRSALMIIGKDIPAIIYVEDTVNKVRRTVTVFHKGQTPKCFRCNGPHLKKDCNQAPKTGGKGQWAGEPRKGKWEHSAPWSKPMTKPAQTDTPNKRTPDITSLSEFPLIIDESIMSTDTEEATLKMGRESDADTISINSSSKCGSRRRKKSMRKIQAAETAKLASESDLSENEPSEVVENTEGPAAQDPTRDTPTDVSQEDHPNDDSIQNNSATDVTDVGDVTDTTTDIVVTEANVIGNRAPHQPRPNGETNTGVCLKPYFREQFLKDTDKIHKAKTSKTKEKYTKCQNNHVMAEIKAIRKASLKGQN